MEEPPHHLQKQRNFDQAFVGMCAAMGRHGELGFSGLRFCGGAESVDAADAQLRERRTYGGVRSVTSKRWMSAVQCTSSRGDPKRVERDMAVIANVFLHDSRAISAMSPSCALCAPTGSDASLVHHYGLPTAWGAPACLHAAACADRNSVMLMTQLGDRSARAPQLLGSGAYMAMELCRSLCEGRKAVRGPGAASPNVVCEAPAPCAPAPAGRPTQTSHSGP
jgi:hypothetical protein